MGALMTNGITCDGLPRTARVRAQSHQLDRLRVLGVAEGSALYLGGLWSPRASSRRERSIRSAASQTAGDPQRSSLPAHHVSGVSVTVKAMTDIDLPGARGTMPMYVAEPVGDGPWPGVVIIHDAAGMSADLRRQADWLAGAGYLAAAPDLFYYGGTMRCLFAVIRQAMAREGDTFDDIETTRRWLEGHEEGTGRVGIIGFCLGGGFAVLMAAGHGFAASSVNYGNVPKDALELLEGACPIVGSYGAKDRGLKDDPDRLRSALEARGIDHDIKVYPEASHMFMNDHDPSAFAWWMVVSDKLTRSGSAFHGPSAADARERIVAFFDRHLKAPRP